jgi:glucokinase
LLNPDIVVVGGGVARAGEKFLKPVRELAKSLVFEPYRRKLQVVPAKLGDTVVVVGAALLAAREI